MIEILTNPYVIITAGVACFAIIFVFVICLLRKLNRNKITATSSMLGKLKLDVGNSQIIGTREKQDDSFATCIADYGVMAIVADGIGGYINGNLASQIAVETYIDEFEKKDVTANLSYYFQKTARLANDRIRDEFGEAKGGTTVVSVVIIGNQMYWSSIGDSNIAVFRNGRMIPVNRKENVKNWLEDQYFAGTMSREEAMGSAMDKRLVNYVGYDGFKKADESDRPNFLKKKDKVLVYSDGVEVLSQIELEKILSKRMSAQKAADSIMKMIEQKDVRSKDNATIIILNVK